MFEKELEVWENKYNNWFMKNCFKKKVIQRKH